MVFHKFRWYTNTSRDSRNLWYFTSFDLAMELQRDFVCKLFVLMQNACKQHSSLLNFHGAVSSPCAHAAMHSGPSLLTDTWIHGCNCRVKS